ncbi:MAG: flgJ [Rhizobacter sp.]|jgi:flagellar protein FlgJ|nr:flgJ [Rhizobacter sp.]
MGFSSYSGLGVGGSAGMLGSPAAGLATDSKAIDSLKATAGRDPKSAIKETAKQFEALFMQELMKSMRAATPSSGMQDNGGTQLGTEMLDSQYANKLTGLPGGLGDMIAKQLELQMNASSDKAITPQSALAPASAAGAASSGTGKAKQSEFVARHNDAAKAIEAETSIPAAFMLGQAAHESGWGKREIRNKDGSSAHNLFGIKAGSAWSGKTTDVTTTEYIGGHPRRVTAKFRAYDSYEDSFRDYAKLLQNNPRYEKVMAHASSNQATAQGFAQGLQRAGYATDPAYADKLTRIITTAQRLQASVT